MSLPLIGWTPETGDDWQAWSQNHFINHQDLAAALFQQQAVKSNVYPISHIDKDNLDQWLYWHATMHNELNQVLGLQGFDLLDFNPDDPDETTQWIQENLDEHLRLCTALGVS